MMFLASYANSKPAAPPQQSSASHSYRASTTYPTSSTLLLMSQSGPPAKPASDLPPPPPPLSAPYSARSLATYQRMIVPLGSTRACGIRSTHHGQGTKNMQASMARMIFSLVITIRNTTMSMSLVGLGRVRAGVRSC
jgi:hypothetical protein